MPRLLVNENFPAPATQTLRVAGADVLSVAERTPGASDEAVLALARAQECWLVTFEVGAGAVDDVRVAVRERGAHAPAGE